MGRSSHPCRKLQTAHCASTVAKTCKLVDPDAKVEVDLGSKKLSVQSVEDRQEFAEALKEAGYPPA
ncbi:MAG: heavy-metal-associated domain-containing protein [Ramlibacter sp.]|nr:heavy-metal-associated domain-containing protein [Ramlibacter sp.]